MSPRESSAGNSAGRFDHRTVPVQTIFLSASSGSYSLTRPGQKRYFLISGLSKSLHDQL